MPCANNITKMLTNLKIVIKSNEYSYKSLRDGQVKLIIKTVDSYSKILKYFDSNNILLSHVPTKQ